MIKIPSTLQTQFWTCLRNANIPKSRHRGYTKWLRYYLDFCQKYHFPQEHQASLPHFLKKLQEKRQTKAQQEQAAHAISLYYELLASIPTPHPSQEGNELPIENWQLAILNSEARSQERNEHASAPTSAPLRIRTEQDSGQAIQKGDSGAGFNDDKKHPPGPPQRGNLPASRPTRTGRGASWQAEYIRLAETLQSRSYDPKTTRAYTKWVRKFQAFTHSKAPESLSSEDAREFLAALPLKHKMSISKQNQVFDALLLFYAHVLKKEFGVIRTTHASDPGSVPRKPTLSPVVSPSQTQSVHAPVPGEAPAERRQKTEAATYQAKTGKRTSWETEYARLANEIKTQHYSPSTFKAYRNWVRKFQVFVVGKL